MKQRILRAIETIGLFLTACVIGCVVVAVGGSIVWGLFMWARAEDDVAKCAGLDRMAQYMYAQNRPMRTIADTMAMYAATADTSCLTHLEKERQTRR